MIELLTTDEMAAADRLTIAAGTSGIALMESAGRAVADAAADPLGGTIAVVCGPGNNGGDGFIAARLLSQRGASVRLCLIGEQSALRGDAAEAAKRWTGRVEAATPAVLDDAALIIDAIFGAGLSRPVAGPARAMIEAMNASSAAILAVDLPSGIQGTTGAVMGTAVHADDTVTFFRRKPGHLLFPGRAHCGRVTVADIGIADTVLATLRPRTFANAPALWRANFPVPAAEAHKYVRGHAVVLSGGVAATGAARLAARAALRAGAGLVTIASPREALAVHAASNLAVMVRPVDFPDQFAALLADPRLNAVLVGPGTGVGEATRAAAAVALRGHRAVVLDADALTSFAGEPQALAAMIAGSSAATVVTPHAGEFNRLFGDDPTTAPTLSKLERTRAAARRLASVVLLKGPDTVIAAPDGRAAINENAPPWLGTAGAGDVLAGMITGLLAQGMDGFDAACAAAWLHGEAGTACGPGLISEDLEAALPPILRKLFGELAPGKADRRTRSS